MCIEKIYLSRHAKNRMRKFGIKFDEIRKSLEEPILEHKSIKGRKNAWIKFKDRFIRVTYVKEEYRTVIITAVVKDKLPGGKL